MSSLLFKLENVGCLRGAVANDCQIFSVYNFINLVCQKDKNDTYGTNTFKRLREDPQFKDEVHTLCVDFKFPGKGQRSTPCMTIRGLQRLLMILGGKVAAEFREIVEGTFSRVMAGDQSLIEVINENAASNAPIHRAYRAAIVAEPVAPVLDELCLKRKRDREERMLELELEERQARLEESKLRNEDRRLDQKDRKLEQVGKSAAMIQSLKTMQNIDARTKLQLEDYAKNLVLGAAGALVAIAGAAGVNETAGLTVSVVAKELGYKCNMGQIQKIGRLVANKFSNANNGSDPDQHREFVDGKVVFVNSYTEKDRALVVEAVREVMEA